MHKVRVIADFRAANEFNLLLATSSRTEQEPEKEPEPAPRVQATAQEQLLKAVIEREKRQGFIREVTAADLTSGYRSLFVAPRR